MIPLAIPIIKATPSNSVAPLTKVSTKIRSLILAIKPIIIAPTKKTEVISKNHQSSLDTP